MMSFSRKVPRIVPSVLKGSMPVLALLLILEPVVRIVLSAFALLMTLTAFLFEFAGTRPFPFFGALAVAIGAFCVLMLYEGLIQLLSGRRD